MNRMHRKRESYVILLFSLQLQIIDLVSSEQSLCAKNYPEFCKRLLSFDRHSIPRRRTSERWMPTPETEGLYQFNVPGSSLASPWSWPGWREMDTKNKNQTPHSPVSQILHLI